jgi:ABC-type nitrate/sulfonate/bicarbonate transport system permease component
MRYVIIDFMRGYHHFSLNRSRRHLLVAFAILVLPLISLLVFSIVNKISFVLSLGDLLISIARLGIAFVFATLIAWILVIVLIRGKTESPALAIFDVLQSLPTFTILPIAVRYLGASELTIILFLTITIIWPIIFSIVSSLKQVDRSWHEAVAISRIKGIDYIRYFLLPVTAPGIVTGAIIGLGDGWEALIATELLLQIKSGVGPFFGNFSDNSATTLFGVLIFLSLIFAINKFIWLPLLEKSHRLVEQ